MQARTLKLHTCTQQRPALIVTAWCAASATLECVTRVLKNAQKLKNVTVFCCLSIFAPSSLRQNDAQKVKD
jgi:uracil phosphoribosyltransferase